MEEKRGANRGSYIWGRSVHNIRIERLWFDFTQGVGAKWKLFFEELEYQADLNPDLPSHIWLLHYLFLDELNHDIMDWANSWNNHKMTIPGMGTRTPAKLRWFSMLQEGARGFNPLLPTDFEPVDELLEQNDIAEYGVDWDAYQDNRIQEHHAASNPTDPFPQNPFVTHRPDSLNMVHVDESRCPFTEEELRLFQFNLDLLPEGMRFSREMTERKQLWICGLNICRQIM
ncbi:hypothetical protein BJ912DRAFT_825641, partial [Pholiota molesta]